MPITINASASGSLLPPTRTFPNTVTNGDFVIEVERDNVHPLVGDGSNETVTWTFDFNSDPGLPCFDPSRGLTSAFLTLILTPMDPWITTDWVKIDDPLFVDIKDPKIQGLRFNQDKPETHSVGIELLHPPYSYAARDILAVFAPSNTIPMKYTDDAIVSGAKLQLVQNDPARLYSVKFVCGDSEGEIVSPGRYFTAINVHNPSCTSVRFRYKVALAFPGEPGEVSPFKEVSLGPDQAFEIDCAQVRELIESDQRFLKGFVVIESEHELDVVAVYTAGAPEVRTLHTERVVPRTNRLPDLVPVPDPRPGFGFCRLDDQRQLLITIRNQGSADAGASLTRVTFASGGSKDIPTPPIPAGGSVTLAPVEMPGECFNPNCHFTIIANANGAVIESNMANNIGTGSCLG